MAEGGESRTGGTRRERAGADADTRDASLAGATFTNVWGTNDARGTRNLPREWRLVRRSEFEAVYREGRRRSSATFLIFLRANGLPRNRFGMSVKKALGNAVVRNRIRRRIREVLRLHREEILPGWDVVIHPSRSVATLEFTKLEAELLALLPREKRAAK